MSGGERTEGKKEKVKREKIDDIRQKTEKIKPSVSAHSEYMALLIEATNDMHESVLELTEIMRKVIAPIKAEPETAPISKRITRK